MGFYFTGKNHTIRTWNISNVDCYEKKTKDGKCDGWWKNQTIYFGLYRRRYEMSTEGRKRLRARLVKYEESQT
jgi:hypothetical protein